MLISFCLVQVSTGDRTLSMHDQLRDLAYSIVREERSGAQRTRMLARDAMEALKHTVRAHFT